MPEAGAADGPAAAPGPRSFLAFDPGTKRVGVASGNTLLGAGRALTTLDAAVALDAIERLVAEWRPDALVVGVPCHPDGAPHAQTRHAERFIRRLRARVPLPVHAVDERYSTTEALAQGARGAAADAAAAAVILSQFLRTERDAPA